MVELTEKNFKEMVLDSDEMWLVEFFAPWCGHCQKLAPEWESAAGQLSGSVNVSWQHEIAPPFLNLAAFFLNARTRHVR